MSAFTKRGSIVVKIWVAEGEQKHIWRDPAEIPQGTTAEEYQFEFKWPSWKDDVYIQSGGMEVVDGAVKLNGALIRYRRFERLIKNWNLRDESGNAVQVTPEAITELDPEIGNAIMDSLDQALGK